MLIEALNESIASAKELSKSVHERVEIDTNAAKAHAVDIPLKKSADEERKIFLISFLLM
jgi:hypothetical protein